VAFVQIKTGLCGLETTNRDLTVYITCIRYAFITCCFHYFVYLFQTIDTSGMKDGIGGFFSMLKNYDGYRYKRLHFTYCYIIIMST